jgi:hypothetical protein
MGVVKLPSLFELKTGIMPVAASVPLYVTRAIIATGFPAVTDGWLIEVDTLRNMGSMM